MVGAASTRGPRTWALQPAKGAPAQTKTNTIGSVTATTSDYKVLPTVWAGTATQQFANNLKTITWYFTRELEALPPHQRIDKVIRTVADMGYSAIFKRYDRAEVGRAEFWRYGHVLEGFSGVRLQAEQLRETSARFPHGSGRGQQPLVGGRSQCSMLHERPHSGARARARARVTDSSESVAVAAGVCGRLRSCRLRRSDAALQGPSLCHAQALRHFPDEFVPCRFKPSGTSSPYCPMWITIRRERRRIKSIYAANVAEIR